MHLFAPRALAAAAGLAICSTAALAVPPIVDRCPKEAMVVVAVPNYASLKQDVDNLGNLIGFPLPGFDQALMGMGIEKGIRNDGSLALVLMAPPAGAKLDDENAPPPAVVLVPVTEYAALMGNFGVTPSAKGSVDTFMAQGKELYAKDIGDGYAAVGPMKGLIEAFTGAPGNKAAFESYAGPVGNPLSDKADMSVIVNMAVARPEIEKGWKARMEEVADQMAMAGAGEGNVEVADWIIKGIVADAKGVVLALNIDNLGTALESVASFGEGTRWAKVAAAPGKAAELLSKLPGGAFLLAGAMDYSSPELKGWLKEMADKMPKGEEKEPEMFGFLKNIDKNNGGAFVIGPSPAGLMGGMFVSSLAYTATTDPDAAIAATKTNFKTLQETGVATVKVTDGEKEIAGVKVDSYEVRFAPDSEMAEGAGILFGPAGGPSGYIAKVPGGVIMTFSKNSALMESAIKAAKGEGALGQDKVMTQVGELLPKGRSMEAYLGVKSILDTVLPALAMFGVPAPTVDIPANLPPIAFAITPGQGSMRGTAYLPAPTIRTIAELGKEFRAGQQLPPQAMPPENKDDAGQPGF